MLSASEATSMTDPPFGDDAGSSDGDDELVVVGDHDTHDDDDDDDNDGNTDDGHNMSGSSRRSARSRRRSNAAGARLRAKLQAQEEIKFYFRFLRCIVIVTAGWFLVLVLAYVPNNQAMDPTTELLMSVMGVVVFVAGILVCCCAPKDLTPAQLPTEDPQERRRNRGRSKAAAGERGGLMDNSYDVDQHDEAAAGGRSARNRAEQQAPEMEHSEDFPYPFAATAIRVRQSGLDDEDVFDDEDMPFGAAAAGGNAVVSQPPRDGEYKIICTAVYFGKTIRSEGTLELCFTPSATLAHGSSPSGWDIQGTQRFQSSTRPLIDGFVNRHGQLYWIVPMPQLGHCTYRGMFDTTSNTIFDGEFKSKTGPKGRIVRMERAGDVNERKQSNDDDTPSHDALSHSASAGKKDIEMVELA